MKIITTGDLKSGKYIVTALPGRARTERVFYISNVYKKATSNWVMFARLDRSRMVFVSVKKSMLAKDFIEKEITGQPGQVLSARGFELLKKVLVTIDSQGGE